MPDDTRQYESFEAVELFCPRCRRATPVRKHLLLVLPGAERYELCCTVCGHSVGDATESSRDAPLVISP